MTVITRLVNRAALKQHLRSFCSHLEHFIVVGFFGCAAVVSLYWYGKMFMSSMGWL